jgi:metal-responsive CopG/Arc/MetJ family transcriptional regulator
MKAVKKLIEVDSNKSITVSSLPFEPGSKVEVIVLPAGNTEDIFEFTDSFTKKRGIRLMSMKEIERIVHEVRGVK